MTTFSPHRLEVRIRAVDIKKLACIKGVVSNRWTMNKRYFPPDLCITAIFSNARWKSSAFEVLFVGEVAAAADVGELILEVDTGFAGCVEMRRGGVGGAPLPG
jgi:hypothetical protein